MMQFLPLSYNQPKLCPTAKWNPNATTFAIKDTVGTGPFGIFVDSNNTVYATNKESGGFVIWPNNSINPLSPVTGQGNRTLKNTHVVFATSDNLIYIDNDYSGHTVNQWRLSENYSAVVMEVNSFCYGLFVDISNTIYCSIHDSNKVVKKSLCSDENTLTTAAGENGNGSASNQLSQPHGIFVDVNFDLYVADCGNDRIQLFKSGQKNGTTIAGNTSVNVTITLSCPTGIVLDADKYLFIVDKGNNHIVRSGPNEFLCIVGCSDSSNLPANKLDRPTSLSFDSYGNLFVTDTKNNRIQKFLLSENSCDAITSSPTTEVTDSNIKCPMISTTLSHDSMDTSTFYKQDDGIVQTTLQKFSLITTANTITQVKSTTIVSFHDSSSITPLLTIATEMTAVQTTLVEAVSSTRITSMTTIKNTPLSNIFIPPYCNDSKRIGLSCDISNTICDLLQPCQNGGVCYNNDTEPLGYICQCPSGFNGTQCQFDHRPCKPSTCWHDGICNVTENGTFICHCQNGWDSINCEKMVNYCDNVTCLNNGVCRPSFLDYKCECLTDSFSGQHCERVSTKLKIYRFVSTSFAYVAIIALISVAMFIIIMDILKYCFGIDPVREERERIRREKQAKKCKPVIQRFVYVNAPPEQATPTNRETAV